jgi:hypothetical protein
MKLPMNFYLVKNIYIFQKSISYLKNMNWIEILQTYFTEWTLKKWEKLLNFFCLKLINCYYINKLKTSQG